MFTNGQPPRLPDAPREYDSGYMSQLLDTLRIFFEQLFATQQINIARLNIDIRTLPTEADLATLRTGDVYADTGGAGHGTGAGVTLKIKS